MKAVDFTQCDASDLAETIGQLHALQSAAHRLVLAAIAAFDEQEGWQEDGATSVVPWLVASLGVSHRTAAEWAGAASKLEELPAIADAYGEGRLSWDHVRPLLRFATPETDADLAESAQGWSAAHTAAVARRARPVPEDDQRDAHPSARCGGGGATAACSTSGEGSPTPTGRRSSRRCGPVAEVEGGPSVTAETARRLACDGRLRLMADDDRGRTVGVGRVTRSVPPWLLRVVRHRDGGCRFTGCGRTAWTDAHHIVYWSQGGPTDACNLVLLCRHHHKLVHEGGWRVEWPSRRGAVVRPARRADTGDGPTTASRRRGRAGLRGGVGRIPLAISPPWSYSADWQSASGHVVVAPGRD